MKTVWFEEYKHCSCTFIAEKKKELRGYCPRHGHDRKYATRIPKKEDMEMGYVQTG